MRALIPSQVSIRSASPTPEEDARRMWDMQLACEPITVLSLEANPQTIRDRLVFFAEIEGVHVGFCVASPGAEASNPLFVQVVAVVPSMQRRGVGCTLLSAAASEEPVRDIVFATQESKNAARAMNARFSNDLGATLERVNLGVYPDRCLDIRRGQGYRVWKVSRPR
ncbi:GNAT family N-acetyltransferase [Microbacterium galbinum]|uniref:GNAT family N-acetyltransferase n=1 Tax=Microbacterium galbinum TaxID=2851646 RepID=A0ABY4ISF4_9MICO|nr:GNAT family N-acetyltransferase [Microbacterium galbinum]UPL15707.1 GNAT family N-acetyltransferase [Microbacterium galbinum]